MIEQWDIEYPSVLVYKVFHADPLVFIRYFIDYIYLFVTCSKSNLLFEFADIRHNIHFALILFYLLLRLP